MRNALRRSIFQSKGPARSRRMPHRRSAFRPASSLPAASSSRHASAVRRRPMQPYSASAQTDTERKESIRHSPDIPGGARRGAGGSAQEGPADRHDTRSRGAGGKIRFGTGSHVCGEARREERDRGYRNRIRRNRSSKTENPKPEAPQQRRCRNRTTPSTDTGTENGLRICRKKRRLHSEAVSANPVPGTDQ